MTIPTSTANCESPSVCIATICACLPAIRILLAQWIPSIFDLSTLRNQDSSRYNSATNPSSSSFTQSRRFFREKLGPSYNKRVIRTPDEELFSSEDNKDDKYSKQIRINGSHFVDSSTLGPSVPGPAPIRDEDTTWLRMSDEVEDVAEGLGAAIALKTPIEWKAKEREIRVVNRISIQSMRVAPETDLLPMPQPVAGSEWSDGSKSPETLSHSTMVEPSRQYHTSW